MHATVGIIVVLVAELFATGAQLDDVRKIYSGKPAPAAQIIEVDQDLEGVRLRAGAQALASVDGLMVSRFDQGACLDEGVERVALAGLLAGEHVLARLGADGRRGFFALGARAASRVVSFDRGGGCVFALLTRDGALHLVGDDGSAKVVDVVPELPDVEELRFGAALATHGEELLVGGAMGEFSLVRGARVLASGRLDSMLLPGVVASSDGSFWGLTRKGTLYRISADGAELVDQTSAAVGGLALWPGHGLVWVDALGQLQRWDGDRAEVIAALGHRSVASPLVADFDESASLQVGVMLESGEFALVSHSRDGYASELVAMDVRANATPLLTAPDPNLPPRLSVPTGLTSREVHELGAVFASTIYRPGASLGGGVHVLADGSMSSTPVWEREPGLSPVEPTAPEQVLPEQVLPEQDATDVAHLVDPSARQESPEPVLNSCSHTSNGSGRVGGLWLLGLLVVWGRRRARARRG